MRGQLGGQSKEFLVYKSSTPLEEILTLERYKNAIVNEDRTKKHSEISKELICKANLGKNFTKKL